MAVSLKKAWNKLQFQVAASDFFPIPQDVREIMENDGWQFRDVFVMAASTTSVGGVITMAEKTPDGRSLIGLENPENYGEFQQARREAAKKVFGIK